MTVADYVNMVTYRFSVPEMLWEGDVKKITDELKELLNISPSNYWSQACRVTCNLFKHEVEVKIYDNGRYTPQNIIDRINSIKIQTFLSRTFVATQIPEPPSSRYLPMSSHMGASSSNDVQSPGASDAEYSTDDSSTYSSGSDTENDSDDDFKSSMMKIRM